MSCHTNGAGAQIPESTHIHAGRPQKERFRHAMTFRRWRPDRVPESCRYDQLASAVPAELAELFGSAG